jgi:hypothetical protein
MSTIKSKKNKIFFAYFQVVPIAATSHYIWYFQVLYPQKKRPGKTEPQQVLL